MAPKIGLHSCGWGERPLPDVLVAAGELGYEGVELAPAWLEKKYDTAEVDRMLREHGVPTVPTVFAGSGNYYDRDAVPAAIEAARKFCRWIRERGGHNVIFSPVPGREGTRTAEEDANVYRAYEAVGEAVIAEGCVPLYHNHYVVSHEVSRQILASDLARMDWHKWKLCLDTGHLVLALRDPIEVFAQWAEVTRWVHFKDVRTSPSDSSGTPKPFVALHPLFTELGDGVVDFRAVLDILAKADYDGWLVVEQDWTDKTPYEAARISRDYLKRILPQQD